MAARTPFPDGPVRAGLVVEAEGLQGAAHLNGSRGTVLGGASDGERVLVAFRGCEGEPPKSLKRANLTVIGGEGALRRDMAADAATLLAAVLWLVLIFLDSREVWTAWAAAVGAAVVMHGTRCRRLGGIEMTLRGFSQFAGSADGQVLLLIMAYCSQGFPAGGYGILGVLAAHAAVRLLHYFSPPGAPLPTGGWLCGAFEVAALAEQVVLLGIKYSEYAELQAHDPQPATLGNLLSGPSPVLCLVTFRFVAMRPKGSGSLLAQLRNGLDYMMHGRYVPEDVSRGYDIISSYLLGPPAPPR